jgi:hypothetical protein
MPGPPAGQGGNELLGNKKQVAHQKLERGNLALVVNYEQGVPVRVVRKNKDEESEFGQVGKGGKGRGSCGALWAAAGRCRQRPSI